MIRQRNPVKQFSMVVMALGILAGVFVDDGDRGMRFVGGWFGTPPGETAPDPLPCAQRLERQ